MSTIIFETTVQEDHLLEYLLPASLPIGSRLRVVIAPLTDEEKQVWEDFPAFRKKHPVVFGYAPDDETASIQPSCPSSSRDE